MRTTSRLHGIIAAAVIVVSACSPTPSPSASGVASATPSGTVTPAPTATAVPGPTATPEPTPSPTPAPPAFVPPAVTPATLPVETGTVLITPGVEHGDVYVMVVQDSMFGGGPERTIVTHLDARGRTTAGWPVAIEGWRCSSTWGFNRPQGVLVGVDGTVRLLCVASSNVPGAAPVLAAVALGPDGTMPGGAWPMEIAGDWDTEAILVGDTLVTGTNVSASDDPQHPASTYRVTSVAADGTVTEGTPVTIDLDNWSVLGRDGIVRVMSNGNRTVTAIGLDGVVAGWPVTFDLPVSGPAVRADGTSVFVQAKAGKSRTMVVSADGTIQGTGSAWLPVTQLADWSGATPAGATAIPLVAADGTTYLLGQRKVEMLVYGIGANGHVLPGFPVTVPWRLEADGRCNAADTGCGVWMVRPPLGKDATVYLPVRPLDRRTGGWVTALTRNGTIRDGWSLMLSGNGDSFSALAIGGSGALFGVHVNRSSNPTIKQVWGIGASGAIRWKVTVVQP